MGYRIVFDEAGNWIAAHGESFPAASVSIPLNARFYRTDVRERYYWNGSSWIRDPADLPGGGSGPTVQEADGSPSVASVSTLQFDQADGFVVSDLGAGVARVDLDAVPEARLALNFPTHDNANDPSSGEKAALAGTAGTPSGTNKYVTNDDARNTNARTPTAHGDALHDATVASLDGGGKVPTAELGGAGADSTKFLRGDQSWAVPTSAPAPDQDARLYGLLALMSF